MDQAPSISGWRDATKLPTNNAFYFLGHWRLCLDTCDIQKLIDILPIAGALFRRLLALSYGIYTSVVAWKSAVTVTRGRQEFDDCGCRVHRALSGLSGLETERGCDWPVALTLA